MTSVDTFHVASEAEASVTKKFLFLIIWFQMQLNIAANKSTEIISTAVTLYNVIFNSKFHKPKLLFFYK